MEHHPDAWTHDVVAPVRWRNELLFEPDLQRAHVRPGERERARWPKGCDEREVAAAAKRAGRHQRVWKWTPVCEGRKTFGGFSIVSGGEEPPRPLWVKSRRLLGHLCWIIDGLTPRKMKWATWRTRSDRMRG